MTDLSAKRRVGILGGMGPEATVFLMSRIIAMTPANDDSDHVPLLVDNNTQVPSRIKALIEGRGEDPGPVLVDMARKLEQGGAQALAMACNTAHHYAPLIQAAVSIPLLNMVELTANTAAKRLGESGASRVGVLASPAVQLTGLFDRYFGARGLEIVYPSDSDALLACIKGVKARGDNPQSREQLKRAAIELHEAGVGVIVVGCSELSIINDAVPAEFTAMDTLDVLAKAVVTFASS